MIPELDDPLCQPLVQLLATGPYVEPLRQELVPDAPRLDFALVVCVIARGLGWSDRSIEAEPAAAVAAVRTAWLETRAALAQANPSTPTPSEAS
jgi:hypothetical protein